MRLLPEIKTNVILLGCLSFICFSRVLGQTTSSSLNANAIVKGRVIDAQSKLPLSHVTFVVFDSSSLFNYKSGFTRENGSFKISGLPDKEFSIAFTAAGYKDTVLKIPILNSTFDIGTVTLVSLVTPLEKVEVVADKPIIQYDVDRTRYNVDADPESKSANLLDILRKVPFIQVNGDEQVLLNGNNNFRFLINGKPSLMLQQNQADILKFIEASSIRSIEVISVPSAKYEAQGIGGIINLVTTSKSIRGFNGSINLRVGDPESYQAGGIAEVTTSKINISANGGYNKMSRLPAENKITREDKIINHTLSESGISTGSSLNKNAGIAFTYDMDSYNLFTAAWSFNQAEGQNKNTWITNMTGSEPDDANSFQRMATNLSQPFASDLTAEFQSTSRKNARRQLIISYRHSKTDDNMETFYDRIPVKRDDIHASQNIDNMLEQYAAIDYVQPVKKHTIEIGMNALQRESDSYSYYKTLNDYSQLVTDENESIYFTFREKIYSGYLSLKLILGKWTLITGGRTEQALNEGNFITSGTATRNIYSNVMPNVSLVHQFRNNIMTISYTQRLNRPDLYFLDPYTDLTDPWNIRYGNPDLKPELSHVFNYSLNLSIKRTNIILSAFHQYSKNSINEITEMGLDSISRTTFNNSGENSSTSANLAINTTLFRKLNLNFSNTGTYFKFISANKDRLRDKEGFTYNMAATASLRFKTWSASASTNINGHVISVQGTGGGNISNSISLNKYIFNKQKGCIGLTVFNPFRYRNLLINEITDPAFHMKYESLKQVRRANLSFSYRFIKIQGKK